MSSGDDLLERLRDLAFHYYLGRSVIEEAADRIEALTAERDEAINQLDSAIHSQIVLEKRTAAVMEDRKFIIAERDRTFALMLARAEKAEAERERLALAICGGEDAPGYANAQTVETLEHVAKQNQQSHGETINSLLAAEAERDRLRRAIMFWLEAQEPDVDAAINMMRAALKGESYE